MIGRAALVALLAAPALGAQGRWEEDGDDRDRWETRDGRRGSERRLYTWRGTVDDDTRIYMRAGRVQSQVVSGARTRSRVRVNEVSALPRRDGIVRVELVEGRGRVHVIQHPSARNDYTAIVRVKDAPGGAGRYRFVAYFDAVDDGRRGDRGRVWGDAGGDVYGGSALLRWSGSVDGDLRIAVRRDQADYQVLSGERPLGVSSRVIGGQTLRRDGQLAVSLRQGRGSVWIEQQPASYNNYTAIVRVRDPQGGYGRYDFDLIWR